MSNLKRKGIVNSYADGMDFNLSNSLENILLLNVSNPDSADVTGVKFFYHLKTFV